MRKSFFCLFGTKIPESELVELLFQKLDMKFIPHSSEYVGLYMKYSGLYAEKITIEQNKIIYNDWKENEFRDYPTLIYLSNIQGKNSDKLSKTEYIKQQFFEIPGIVLLREEILED
jgi:hypothetical protein